MKRLADDYFPDLAGPAAARQTERLDRLKARRKRWLDVHLWLGLILGFFLAVFGVTGAILVFYEEIDTWLHGSEMQVSPPAEVNAPFRPFGEIIRAANASLPSEAKLRDVQWPPGEDSAIVLGYRVKQAEDREDEWRVNVNTYTGRITGKQRIKGADDLFPSSFIPFVFQLHFALLAGETGMLIVAIMSVFLLFSVLTGLILWWPLTGNWRRVLLIKRKASVERFNHDLHQSSGFYTCAVLLAVLLSGIYMNLPTYFAAPVKLLSPGTRDFTDRPHVGPAQGRKPIGLDRAVEIVRARFPEGRLSWMSGADEEAGLYLISLRDVPGLSRFWSERLVSVNAYNGDIADVHDPLTRRTAGETFLDWQWPLHSGKAFGWTGRILVLICGLACPALFVTGVIRWLQKRRAARSRPLRAI